MCCIIYAFYDTRTPSEDTRPFRGRRPLFYIQPLAVFVCAHFYNTKLVAFLGAHGAVFDPLCCLGNCLPYCRPLRKPLDTFGTPCTFGNTFGCTNHQHGDCRTLFLFGATLWHCT